MRIRNILGVLINNALPLFLYALLIPITFILFLNKSINILIISPKSYFLSLCYLVIYYILLLSLTALSAYLLKHKTEKLLGKDYYIVLDNILSHVIFIFFIYLSIILSLGLWTYLLLSRISNK
jgi:hypothetical protein